MSHGNVKQPESTSYTLMVDLPPADISIEHHFAMRHPIILMRFPHTVEEILHLLVDGLSHYNPTIYNGYTMVYSYQYLSTGDSFISQPISQ